MTSHFLVQLENRPGQLAQLARALAARGIDIRHIAAGGAGSYAFAVLETDDAPGTASVLVGMGASFLQGETVVVEVDDRPGGLAEVTEHLASAGINIQSVLRLGERGGKMEIALTVDDPDRAREILAGYLVSG
jgi:hypothetical protein